MWDSGAVGFHQADINGFLKNHWSKLTLKGDEKVLVPLCGKSLDMVWLAQQGHKILGIELSQKALDEFLQENQLEAKVTKTDKYCGYELPDMTLLCGDFFHLQSEQCENVGVVYDRAALIALPLSMREQYVSHLKQVLKKGTQYLLVTMEYDSSLLQGPPFSVSEQEVNMLFAEFDKVKKVEQMPFKRKGVDAVEKVYVIEY